MDRIEEYARQRSQPLMTVLHDVELDQSLSARAREAALEFVRLIDDLAITGKGGKVKPVLVQLLEKTAYRDFVRRTDEKDATARVEIVDEFVSACAQFDERNGGDLTTYLQELALVSDVDTWDDSKPAVTLITCHSAKGLEFDYVYLVGLEEGLLPHASAGDSDDELEEERRLCYVAMTRARFGLALCRADSRLLYGERCARRPSRFLGEIGVQRTVPVRSGGPKAAQDDARGTSKPRRGDQAGLKMGTRVWHAQFGKGVVMYTSGAGAKLRARIRFQAGRTRDFMVSAAPLRILDGDKS
jgi:DNA helicase-2/ATP-dependent DNA helicase PcrA